MTVYTEAYDQQGDPFYRDVPVLMRTTLYTEASERLPRRRFIQRYNCLWEQRYI